MSTLTLMSVLLMMQMMMINKMAMSSPSIATTNQCYSGSFIKEANSINTSNWHSNDTVCTSFWPNCFTTVTFISTGNIKLNRSAEVRFSRGCQLESVPLTSQLLQKLHIWEQSGAAHDIPFKAMVRRPKHWQQQSLLVICNNKERNQCNDDPPDWLYDRYMKENGASTANRHCTDSSTDPPSICEASQSGLCTLTQYSNGTLVQGCDMDDQCDAIMKSQGIRLHIPGADETNPVMHCKDDGTSVRCCCRGPVYGGCMPGSELHWQRYKDIKAAAEWKTKSTFSSASTISTSAAVMLSNATSQSSETVNDSSSSNGHNITKSTATNVESVTQPKRTPHIHMPTAGKEPEKESMKWWIILILAACAVLMLVINILIVCWQLHLAKKKKKAMMTRTNSDKPSTERSTTSALVPLTASAVETKQISKNQVVKG